MTKLDDMIVFLPLMTVNHAE